MIFISSPVTTAPLKLPLRKQSPQGAAPNLKASAMLTICVYMLAYVYIYMHMRHICLYADIYVCVNIHTANSSFGHPHKNGPPIPFFFRWFGPEKVD